MNYGKELILDMHDCNTAKFNRKDIKEFFKKLCKEIDMVPEDLFFWDYEGDEKGNEEAPEHLAGTSAVQFIRTSNITIHTLDKLERVYLNIFSCKDFNTLAATNYAGNYFGSKNIVRSFTIDRL